MEPFQLAINALHDEKPGRDFILISAEIEKKLHDKLTEVVGAGKKGGECAVFLTTTGGDPHAGFRIARCLQHHYTRVRLIVPSYCKSAGTLIAIGANELAFGDLGELGPLDVQVSKQTEIFERGSGLDYTQALLVAFEHAQTAFSQSLLQLRSRFRFSTKMAGELAAKLACGVAEPLYAQIDPNRIGEMQRAIQIAHEYGTRLDAKSKNLKTDALDKLVAGYPSHSFVIDRKEARQLFKSVDSLTSAEAMLCNTLSWLVRDQSDFCELLTYVAPPPQQDAQNVPQPADDQPPGDAPGAPAGHAD